MAAKINAKFAEIAESIAIFKGMECKQYEMDFCYHGGKMKIFWNLRKMF